MNLVLNSYGLTTINDEQPNCTTLEHQPFRSRQWLDQPAQSKPVGLTRHSTPGHSKMNNCNDTVNDNYQLLNVVIRTQNCPQFLPSTLSW
jgi:hypothetical protein